MISARQQPSDKEMYQNLFQFIKKNRQLPLAIDNTNPDAPEVIALQKAIELGDFNHPIFENENSHIYLLYLMREEKIKFWHGITVYVYLMVLMQFTNKLNLKEKDTQYKCIKDITVSRLSIDGQLTPAGDNYITEVTQRLLPFQIKINRDELENYIRSLPAAEQWLIDLPESDRASLYETNTALGWLNTISENLPYAGKLSKNREKYSSFKIASSSVLNYLQQRVTPHASQMQPCFGTLGFETLEKLHSEGLHPVPLYSPLVVSNTLAVHKRKDGPIGAWGHDVTHNFCMSLLTIEERNQIFKYHLPQIRKSIQAANKCDDHSTAQIFSNYIKNLVDFDLTNINNYHWGLTRFDRYLDKIYGLKYFSAINFKFFLFILKEYFSNTWSKEEKEYWLSYLCKYTNNQALDYIHNNTRNPVINKENYFANLKSLIYITKLLNNTTEDIPWHELQDQHLLISESDKMQKYPMLEYALHFLKRESLLINWSHLLNLINHSENISDLWDNIYKECTTDSNLFTSIDNNQDENECTAAIQKYFEKIDDTVLPKSEPEKLASSPRIKELHQFFNSQQTATACQYETVQRANIENRR